MFNQSEPLSPQQIEEDKHSALLRELGEIKKYAIAIHQTVDTEINEIRATLQRIERQQIENDRQIDKIEQFERTFRNVESQLKTIERKIK